MFSGFKRKERDEQGEHWIPLPVNAKQVKLSPPTDVESAITVAKDMFLALNIQRDDWFELLNAFCPGLIEQEEESKEAFDEGKNKAADKTSMMDQPESVWQENQPQSIADQPQGIADQPQSMADQPQSMAELKVKPKLKGRAKEVYDLLTDGASLPCTYISAYKLLNGFPINGNVQFFPNPLILERYMRSIDLGATIEFRGPISIGKSYNLALFKLLLAANYKYHRVIYIHNLEDWLTSPPETVQEWLETQLVYTFMEELQHEENIGKFVQFFQDNRNQPLMLRRLFTDIFPPGNKITFLLIDQYNVWRRPVSVVGVTHESLPSESSSKIISVYLNEMKKLAQCFMTVSSMTAEIEKIPSNMIYLNKSLPDEVLEEYVKFTLGVKAVPFLVGIKKWTNGNPGEIMKISLMDNEDIEEKISSYCETRIISIINDFQDFMNKKRMDSRCKEEDLIHLFQMLAIYIDLPSPYSLPLDVKSLWYMYDGRYIQIDERKRATSVLPLVQYALRRIYFSLKTTRDELTRIILGNSDASVYGKLLEDYLIKALAEEKNFQMKLKKSPFENPSTFHIQINSQLQEFSNMQLLSITPYETKICRPTITTFPGIDFILVTPENWYFCQAKSVLDTEVLTKFDHFSQNKIDLKKKPRIYKTKQALKALVERTEKESLIKRNVIWVLLYLQIDSKSSGKLNVTTENFKLWSAFDLPDNLQIKVPQVRSK